jgi:Spy/CpxP family protein refolding chaperone
MKFRKTHIAAFLTASAIALAVPFAASARPFAGDSADNCPAHGQTIHGDFGKGGGPAMMGSGTFRALRGLDLTEAQRDKIFDLSYKQMPTLRDKVKELRTAREELRTLSRTDAYDEAKVKALTEQAAGTMAELAQLHARTEHEIYSLLTPEQRKDLSERQAGHEEWRGRHRGMRGGAGMGRGMGPGMGGFGSPDES